MAHNPSGRLDLAELLEAVEDAQEEVRAQPERERPQHPLAIDVPAQGPQAGRPMSQVLVDGVSLALVVQGLLGFGPCRYCVCGGP